MRVDLAPVDTVMRSMAEMQAFAEARLSPPSSARRVAL